MTWTRDYGLIDTLARTNDSVRGWETAALREGAPGIRSVLAYFASRGTALYPGVLDTDPSDLEPRASTALARVMALQAESDVDGAIRLLRGSSDSGAQTSGLTLLAQLLLTTGRLQECADVLARVDPALPPLDRAALDIDLAHPRHGGERGRWWSRFCTLFTDEGLEPPFLTDSCKPGSGLPMFDQIRGTASTFWDEGPLVTVVLTTSRPEHSLMTSTRSVLAQSWRPLEVIVVDDASGPEYASVLDELEALDHRVRVLRRRENAGTHAARNTALEVARGEYLTCQDGGDWSHPRRIERQLQPLLDGTTNATCVRAVRTDEHLCLVQPGRQIVTPASATYMAKRSDIVRAGGFLTARRGVYSELIRRMEVITGTPHVELSAPLGVCRQTAGSLSCAHLRPAWQDPARSALWSSATEVHDRIRTGELSAPEGLGEIVVPARLGGPPGPQHLDVVIAADFSHNDLTRLGVLPEVLAAAADGRRVGILHLDDARGHAQGWTRLNGRVQRMINDRNLHQILLDDAVSVGDLAVLAPRALQFPPSGDRRIRADRGWIIADRAPSDPTLRSVSYVPSECSESFEELFGVAPTWVARDHLVRGVLAPTMRDGSVAEECLPYPASLPSKGITRRPRPTLGPVAGRVATSIRDWPDDQAVLASVYPCSGREIRVLGSTRHALKRLDRRALPASWVVFETGDLPLAAFLRQIDAYVDFPGLLGDGVRARSVALAAGVPVVLPRELAPTYRDAALYAEPGDVGALLSRIVEDPALVAAQALASRSFARDQLKPHRRPWL